MTMNPLRTGACLLFVVATTRVAQADPDLCKAQAEQVITRLEAEVVGTLQNDQREAANTIVMDVCQLREEAVQEEITEAVEKTREEEQDKASAWLTKSADKAGNKRLKRKGSY